MQNLHRHSSYSNLFTSADSAASNEDYAKRAVELGHKVLSSVEHGWQGNVWNTFELAKKYNLKCVIGSEAYWVKNRREQDRSNHHILICCKSNMGREAMNDALSEANLTGYYFRPRLDIELLLKLPPKDVMITSACIAFTGYEDIDEIILQLHDHFGENFFLEAQPHDNERQVAWTKHQVELHDKYGIQFIAGLDSHYILSEDAKIRDYLLEAKGISYPDEEGWYMDYPNDEELVMRYKKQGVLTTKQIFEAMDNTDVALDFCDYDKVRVFMKDIKLPSLYPNLTAEQKNLKYRKLISKKFVNFMKRVPKERYQEYFDGVKSEIETYQDTGMVDYPLLDYAIVKDAIEHGCIITDTGRGSGAGYLTNTLCGFSKVDRFASAIKLYPERFISKTRILETKSLPDLDLNTGTPDLLAEAQERVMGADHAVAMVAFGTLKKKSAFKIYAKAQGMEFDLANKISSQIGDYEKALKDADDEDKDMIDLYDYVDPQYQSYIEASEAYWGVISDKKKAPSAYLLYDGNIRREIGLMKCKSESTKKEYIVCVMDGAVAESYKFLKNDILKVDSVYLIDKVFKRIGIEHFDVTTLIEKVKDDKAVWDAYANGYTMGVNQVEQAGSRKKCMRYKPHNVSELSAFVAAIRPGFKSMYRRFEDRENFSWGIPALDNLLRTKEMPVSWLLYQEQVMSVLNWAGFPMDQCYGAIKNIAKKHPEKVLPLKEKFIEGFRDRLIKEENLSIEEAEDNSKQVWQIVSDNCGYSFNSSHSYCMALDSLYQMWQKVHYPYEFYETLERHYAEKGNKDKVAALKQEAFIGFGIREGDFGFRNDHRDFTADPVNHVIYPALSSIKGLGKGVATDLYRIKDKQYDSFIDLLMDIRGKKINAGHLTILIKLNFFNEFGGANSLLKQAKLFDSLYGRKSFNKDGLGEVPERVLKKYAIEKPKSYTDVNWLGLCRELCEETKKIKTSKVDLIRYEVEILGYVHSVFPNVGAEYYYIMGFTGSSSQFFVIYQLKTGQTRTIRYRKKCLEQNPTQPGDIIKILEEKEEGRWRKDSDGHWQQDWSNTEPVLQKWTVLS